LVVQVSVREAFAGLTPDQRQHVPQVLLERITAISHGRHHDSVEELGPALRGSRADWRQLLRRFVRRAVELRPVFNRPPRRFLGLVGIVPGRVRRYGKARVLAVIDTSGSVSAQMLADISAELDRMSRSQDVVVVECDTEVRAHYPYRGPLRHVHGRGGTDLRPPLRAAFLNEVRPDVVVYFTDGHGPSPPRAPATPLIWCLVPGGRPPASWGRVIYLDGS
jgi:predicted metal-dependent peptidase